MKNRESTSTFVPHVAAAAIAFCAVSGGTSANNWQPNFSGAGTGNTESLRLAIEDRGPRNQRRKFSASSGIVSPFGIQTSDDQYANQWSQKIDAQLVSLVSYGENWDGEGARAFSSAVVGRLRSICWQLPTNIPAPTLKVGSEGNAGIYWDTLTGYVELDVLASGEYCIYHAGEKYEPIAYHEVRTMVDALDCFMREWSQVVAAKSVPEQT